MRASALLAVGISLQALTTLIDELVSVSSDDVLKSDLLECRQQLADALGNLETVAANDYAMAIARIRDLAWNMTMIAGRATEQAAAPHAREIGQVTRTLTALTSLSTAQQPRRERSST